VDAGLTYPFGYFIAKHGDRSASRLADQIQDVAMLLSRRLFFCLLHFFGTTGSVVLLRKQLRQMRKQMHSVTTDSPDSPITTGGQKSRTAYGSTKALFDEIRDFFAQHPGLAEDSILKLTYFAFAILFSNSTPVWPFVYVVSTDAAGSTLLLRLLKCVYQRALHLGEVTLNAILSLPLSEPPTLLIDQPARTRELERALRIISRPGGGIVRKGQLLDPFCPVVLCMAEPLHDRWLVDQAIPVLLTPTQSPLPRLDPQSLERTAKAFQAKLFQYREINLDRVRESQYDAPQFSSPTREIAILLGSAIVDDPALTRLIIPLLEDQDQDARVRQTDSIAAVEIEAGLFLCHEPKRNRALVGELTTIANGILEGRNETVKLEPRAVGDHLRLLGLFSERLGRAGRGIRFVEHVRRKIHQLAWAYDVRSIKDRADRCEFCAEARVRYGKAPEQGD
jgi:hypothetical protein